jgi:hypothetical protein
MKLNYRPSFAVDESRQRLGGVFRAAKNPPPLFLP